MEAEKLVLFYGKYYMVFDDLPATAGGESQGLKVAAERFRHVASRPTGSNVSGRNPDPGFHDRFEAAVIELVGEEESKCLFQPVN